MSKRQNYIRKEMAKEIKRLKPECKDQKNVNRMVNEIRHKTNEKYGHDWRWTER